MSSFEHHWSDTADVTIPERKLKQAEFFLQPIIAELYLQNDNPIQVLDAGCGDGVHLKVIYDQLVNSYKIHCTAVDIASSAINKVTSSFPASFLTAKVGDIQKLDESEENFDLVISYGVIAYVESPKQAVIELLRVLKKGGMLALWIYPIDSRLKANIFKFVRSICHIIGDRGTSLLCHSLIPFMAFLPISSGLSLRNSSWRACHEVLMVNLNPEHLDMLTRDTLIQWLNDEGCSLVEVTDSIPGALYVRK